MDKQAFQNWCKRVVSYDGSPAQDAHMVELIGNVKKFDPQLGALLEVHDVSRHAIINHIKSKTQNG